MGTSLALVGAYVLAGEIAKHQDPKEAFASYEKIMRPYVGQAQKLPPGAPRLAHPKTKAGIAVFHLGVRLVARLLASGIGNKWTAPPADEIELPSYSGAVSK